MRSKWEEKNLLSEQVRVCHSPNGDTAPGSKMPRVIPNIPTIAENIALCHTLDNDIHQTLTTVANKKWLG